MNDVVNGKKKSEVLAGAIKRLTYGDIISHKNISEIIEVVYPSNKYRTTIKQTRKILEKDGLFLEAIPGTGYRIVQPDNVVDHAPKHYKRGFNEMKKGYDTIQNAPTKDMTPEARDTYRRVNDRAVTLAAAMSGVKVELKSLARKKHPMAVENVNR